MDLIYALRVQDLLSGSLRRSGPPLWGLSVFVLGLGEVLGEGCGFEREDIPRTCPEEMARIEGESVSYCIHRYEVGVHPRDPAQGGEVSALVDHPEQAVLHSEAGEVPSRATFLQAVVLCESQGFHLCTSAEWEDACDQQPGPGGRAFPTVDGTYSDGVCNFTSEEAPTSSPLAPTGSYPRCCTPAGVCDLSGNLWEWTDPGLTDAQGQSVPDKRGGAHYSRIPATCSRAAVGTHLPTFEGSITFRCCLTLR